MIALELSKRVAGKVIWQSKLVDRSRVPEVHACVLLLKRGTKRSGTALETPSYDRPAARIAGKKIARVMKAFFKKAAKDIGAQLLAAATQVLKAEDDQTEHIMGAIDLSVLEILPDELTPILQGLYDDTATLMLQTIRIAAGHVRNAPELDPRAFDQVSEDAAEWAAEHAAEMIGKKWVDGKLIDNPSAEWRIDEFMREGIRSLIAQTVRGDISVIDLPKALEESYGFSPERAELIARTEVHRANGEGAIAGMRASGLVTEKVWLTSNDDLVSEECDANQEEGPIPIDDEFSSGDDTEPAHPNCRCSVAPYVTWDNEPESTVSASDTQQE